MDTRAFLEAVWPSQGVYCLATPNPVAGYSHNTFNSINECVSAIAKMRDTTNLFFCVHTLKEHRLWNPAKRDPKTGELGAWERRTHANMKESRAFFFDLDVGEGKGKYVTQQEALDGLELFLFRTQLPAPLVTSSGGGFHIYWRLSDPLASDLWRRHASTLRRIAERLGLRADPARTNDQSSVLRVVGTFNVKPNRKPRPCVAFADGRETSTQDFLTHLDELAQRWGVHAGLVSPAFHGVVLPAYLRQGGNLHEEWSGETHTLDEVKEVCEHVRDFAEAEGAVPEPVWYAMLGLVQHLERGDELVHELSEGDPRYTPEATDAKLARWNQSTDGNPPTCEKLDNSCGGDACARCQFASLGKNPLLVVSAVKKAKRAPPAVVTVAPVMNLKLDAPAYTILGEPPNPYTRTKRGVTEKITVTDKDENGDKFEKEIDVVVCPYDIFPVELCDRTIVERAYSRWVLTLPHDGQRLLKIDADTITDQREFFRVLHNEGVSVPPKQGEGIRMLLIHWQNDIRKKQAASKQFDHLGWADKAHTQFVLPNVLLSTDGMQRSCSVSTIVQGVAKSITTEGSLEEQVKLLDFYKDPKYFKHQFLILCALAAPALHATGHAGLVVNMAGETGAGKSAALEMGASFWGDPKTYIVNGTATGASALRQQTDAFSLANLPFCVDEISKSTDGDEAIYNFVMGSTQTIERTGNLPNGKPRPVRETFKSTFYICTSNKSFHDVLSRRAESGAAGAMRVFEMWCDPFAEGKTEADEHRLKVQSCYGWIGPAALQKYVQHRQYVDDAIRAKSAWLDKNYKMIGPERYYTAVIAVVLVYAEFAQAHGLIPFDLKALRKWLLDVHLPYLRQTVIKDKKAQSPQTILAAFLFEKQSQILRTVIDASRQWADNQPPSAIIAEHDTHNQRLYVVKEAFRAWLYDRKHNALKIIKDLENERVILRSDTRRAIGAGTPYAFGRPLCLEIDMTHPEFAAQAPAPTSTSNVVPLKKGKL